MPVSKKRKKKKKNKSGNKNYNLKVKKSFQQKVRESEQFKDFKITKFKDSVSELVLDFGSDILEICVSNEDYLKFIPFTILCWNIGNFKKSDREAQIKNVKNKLGFHEFEKEIRMLVNRKIDYYSEYRYIIMNYDITFPKGGLHLMVASTKAD